VLGALTLAGITALMTIEGATSGAVFSAFVTNVLVPTLRKGDVVVMDNLGAHKVDSAKNAIEAVGARIIFQPPYSPDMNPIEHGWSKVKNDVAKQEPRTIQALDKAIANAAQNVTKSDAKGWFKNCGVAYQVKR
jgi:transposase